MRRARTITYLLALAIGASGAFATAALDGDQVAEAAKKKKKKKKKKKAVVKVKLSAEQKKAREELMGPYKFGMTKDEVVAALQKQIEEKYAEQLANTEDVSKQDKLRKEMKKEIKRFAKSWVEFKGEASRWDVSIIGEQFKRNVDEAMLDYWENQDGKNQRRFFFFDDGYLYKMFVQIDTTQFSEEQQSFDFFASFAAERYGKDVIDPKTHYGVGYAAPIFVQALDKIRTYDAFCLVIADPERHRAVDADRKERVDETVQKDKVIQEVTKDGHNDPDFQNTGNKDAVKDVIKDGEATKKKKKKGS
jgi:hypothetical protein